MEKSQVQIIDLKEEAKQNAIEGATENLAESFKPFFKEAQEIMEASASVKVENLGQTAEMGLARKYRLKLVEIRRSAEKRRVELKEDSLRTGRAIDGLNNLLLYKIKPMEEYLQKQENYGLELRKKAQENTRFEREQAAGIYLPFFPAGVHLGEIAEEEFEKYYRFARMEYDEKQRLEKEAEAEKRRLEAERLEMLAENKRLREAAEKLEAEAATQRAEAERVQRQQQEEINRQRAEAERIQREAAEKERAEAQRIEQEQKAKAAAEKAAKEAPDREKLRKFGEQLAAFMETAPIVESKEANDILSDAAVNVQKVIDTLLSA